MREIGENVADDTGIRKGNEISCKAVVRLNSSKRHAQSGVFT